MFTKSYTDLIEQVDNFIQKLCPEPPICGGEKDDCHELATCKDTGPATYQCTCNEGYVGDGKTCREIQICGTPKDDCHQFATCRDTGSGGYECTCNSGYQGDGKNCNEIKICGSP
ncbi:EGF domain-containing protein, partial [Salmonella sp. s54412]|uniref:EGF domain-containing protein n=1 Tax=Salmonella sp. s54412 TaxID=3160128 RepID=UPI003754FBC6